MREVFERYQPQVVFHAAAYKHVGMLEANPLQAVSNNVLATRTLAEVAVEFERRAVRAHLDRQGGEPEERRWASRRRCASGSSRRSRCIPRSTTRFVAVRFGNVLGSSGSVIPIFRRQIERGGPVTRDEPGDDALLHDDPGGVVARRAGGRDGRARPGVRARHGRAGADPRPREADDPPLGPQRGRDPDRLHGRAPGEKMHEVLWNEGETVGPTSHPKIMRAARPQIDPGWLEESLAELERLVEEGDTVGVVAKLAAMVDEPGPHGARSGARRHVALTSQCPPRARLRCLGGPARRPEPGTAPRGGGGARAGLHPRRRGLRQDDDDHAADRAAGRDRGVRARTRSWR